MCRRFTRACPWESKPGEGGSRTGWRSGAGVQSEGLSLPHGSFGAGVALQSCPELGQGDLTVYLQHQPVFGCRLILERSWIFVEAALSGAGQS